LKERGFEDKDAAYPYRSDFDDKGEKLFDLEQIPDDWMNE